MQDAIYLKVAEQVDEGFQGAPKSEGEISKAFLAYLKLIYTPEEAELVQHLNPTGTKSPAEAATPAKLAPLYEARNNPS